VALSSRSPEAAQILQAEAERTGRSISTVAKRPELDVPRERATPVVRLIRGLLTARAHVLRTLDAIKAGLGPQGRPPNDEESPGHPFIDAGDRGGGSELAGTGSEARLLRSVK
jgi:hypothetical protein